ncbi:hypothetical protein BDFB_007389, partial [Asbolus verrucosus]
LFRETGSAGRKPRRGCPTKQTFENIEEVREIVVEVLHMSVYRISQRSELGYGTSQLILKKDLNKHPYKLTAVHELLLVDYAQIVQFCQWFMQNMNNNDLLDVSFSPMKPDTIFLSMLIRKIGECVESPFLCRNPITSAKSMHVDKYESS